MRLCLPPVCVCCQRAVAVLHKSPKPRSLRPATTTTATAFVTLVVFGAVTRDTARTRSSSLSLPRLTLSAVRFFRSVCGGAFRAALV